MIDGEIGRLLSLHGHLVQAEAELLSTVLTENSRIASIGKSCRDNDDPDDEYLRGVYRELGLMLPDSVRERYENVALFRASITRNRKVHLAGFLEDHVARLQTALDELARVRSRQHEVYAEICKAGAPLPVGVAQAKTRLVEPLPGF